MDSPAASAPANPHLCRVCGHPMTAKFQLGTARVASGFIVTCANPACWMHDYTFSEHVYPSVQLSDYQPVH